MARKRKQVVNGWQRRPQGSKHFLQVYDDLLDSASFHDLTARQVRLYLYCVRESHGAAMRDNAKNGGTGDQRLFYMNQSLRTDVHELYPKSDTRGFERDMQSLIEHGFVDCVKSGYAGREKSVYRLSARWHEWGLPGYEVPDSVKTVHMGRVQI